MSFKVSDVHEFVSSLWLSLGRKRTRHDGCDIIVVVLRKLRLELSTLEVVSTVDRDSCIPAKHTNTCVNGYLKCFPRKLREFLAHTKLYWTVYWGGMYTYLSASHI